MTQHNPSNPENPAAPVSPTSATAGDDVMKVLADVEGQLTRLRGVQKTQDEMINSMAERARALRKAEQTIEQSQQELARQQQALQHDRDELQAQRTRLDQARAEIEQDKSSHGSKMEELRRGQADFEARQRDTEAKSADLARREGDLRQEQARVAAQSAQAQADRDQFIKRTGQMEADRAELLQRITQAEANVGELIQEVERSNQRLAERASEIKKATDELTSLRERAKELGTAAKQAAERADQAEKDSAELARMADRERGEVTQKLAASTAEAESLRQRCASLEKSIQSMQQTLDERTAQLTESQRKLEHAGRKLSEFAQILSEQTPQLERGAAAVAMIDQYQEQIERLTKQLADATLKSDPEEVKRRDDRIDQLTEALRQARGQNVNDQGVAEVEQRNAFLEAELGQLRLELQNAQLAAEQAKTQLQENVGSQAVATVQDASMAENAAKVAALTAEIENLHAQAAADLQAKLEAQSTRHRQALEDAHHADEETIASMRERIAELESSLKEASSSKGARKGKGDAPQDELTKKLRKQAEQVSAVADHLRRRKSRLRKLRSLMAQQAMAGSSASMPSSGEMRGELIQKLELERSQLADVRQMLSASERAMIRKWARPKAVLTLASIFLLAAICAGASWLVTDQLYPARISASVAFEARTQDHSKLSPETAEQWRTWHTQLLEDESFRQMLSKRLADRRLDSFADPARLAQRMKDDLTVDAVDDGMIVFTMAGNDADETTAFLDVLASTIMTESSRQMTSRADNTAAIPTNERREEGRVYYATINPVPIKDDRLMHALPIFGGMFLVTLVLIFVVYGQLVRAKRIFDQDNGTLFLDAKIHSA